MPDDFSDETELDFFSYFYKVRLERMEHCQGLNVGVMLRRAAAFACKALP